MQYRLDPRLYLDASLETAFGWGLSTCFLSWIWYQKTFYTVSKTIRASALLAQSWRSSVICSLHNLHLHGGLDLQTHLVLILATAATVIGKANGIDCVSPEPALLQISLQLKIAHTGCIARANALQRSALSCKCPAMQKPCSAHTALIDIDSWHCRYTWT